MSEGVESGLVGQFALCLLPALLSFTIPCAVLVGVLISFGRLAAENEILAVRTSGVSLMTIFYPVILFGVIISSLMIYMNYSTIPNLNFKSKDYLYQIEFQLINTLRPGRFYDELGAGDASMTFYYGARDPENADLLNIHMRLVSKMYKWTGEEVEDKKKARKKETLLLAERGSIVADPESKTIKFKLINGSFHPIVRDNPGQNNVIRFRELTRVINPSIGRVKKGVYRKKNREMTVPDLKEDIKKQIKLNDIDEANESRVILLQRFSNPMACLAFILIGMPLAIYIKPSGKSMGFAISFALLFFYYLLMKWGSSWGEMGHPLTPLAVFAPNIVLGSLGCILIYKQTRK
jgi:lipopolysaccharide export system permease protein